MKRIAILILQLIVTAAGLFYVFHDAATRAKVWQALRESDWRWLLLGWACYGLVEVLATVRWQLLLRVQGIVLGWLRAAAIVIIGLFFNLFLPGLVGGDAMRLYFVFKAAPRQKTRATLSVAIDRLIGLLSLLILAAAVTSLRFGWLSRFPQTTRITYLALVIVGVSTLFALAIFVAAGLAWVKRLPKRFPFRKAIVRAGGAVRLYGTRPGVCLIALGLTLLAHLAYYLSYYCAAHSLHQVTGGGPNVLDFLSVMPLVNTITGVPVSFGGVGVRETLFQKLLGQLASVPGAAAALAASLGFAIQASWGLLGGAAYLFLPLEKARTRRRAHP